MSYDSPARGGGRGGFRGRAKIRIRGPPGCEFTFTYEGTPPSSISFKIDDQKRKFDEDDDDEEENNEIDSKPINKKAKGAPVDKKRKVEESDDDEEMDEEESDEEVAASKAAAVTPAKGIIKKEETKSNKNVHISKPSTLASVAAPAKKEEPAVVKKEPVAAPKRKFTASTEVISDQEKRREEEHKKTLYLKAFDRNYDEDKIKALHALIIGVRRPKRRNYAFAKFASEADANKAYSALSKVKGLTVDYCHQKSKTHKKLIETKSTARPIDPTLLCIRPIVGAVSKAQLKTIFKTASDVKISNRKGQTDKYALVRFESEEEARNVFSANKALKINGASVSIDFACDREAAEMKGAPKQIEKKAAPPTNQFVEESDDEESDDYDEKIEEEDEEEPPKKKVKKEPKTEDDE